MNKQYTTLCHPDQHKSCFFCCPPLRPPHYDPLDHRQSLDRRFRQNCRDFQEKQDRGVLDREPVRPINGWECWGLGYLDTAAKRAGCLLHPFHNDGTDYRHLVDYGTKCARELCLEAKTFEALTGRARQFYLGVTGGMNSFEYSSRKFNPIFGLLLWGPQICEAVAGSEGLLQRDREKLRSRYALLLERLSYKTDGYFIEKVVFEKGIDTIVRPDFIEKYLPWREGISERIIFQGSPRNGGGKPVHLLPIPLSLARFLKFTLNAWQATADEVGILKDRIDEDIGRFIELELGINVPRI